MIYFLQNGDKAVIKIGYTGNLERRRKTFQTASSTPYEHIYPAISGDRQFEHQIHSDLVKYRKSGEFFQDCPEVRAYIEKLQKAARDDADFAEAEERIEVRIKNRRLEIKAMERALEFLRRDRKVCDLPLFDRASCGFEHMNAEAMKNYGGPHSKACISAHIHVW